MTFCSGDAMVRSILDLATVKCRLSYSTRSLQVFGPVGLSMGAAGTVITAWLGLDRLFGGQAIGNRPTLLVGVLLL